MSGTGAEVDTAPLYAVLSGDIVGSSRFMDSGPTVRDAITSAYRACAEAFEDALGGLPKVDVFAGDSWQMLVRSPAAALSVALCMRALIRSNEQLPEADTRIAIGIGTVEFIEQDRLSQSQGEAFTLSGEALDGLPDRGPQIAVALPERWRRHTDEQLLDPQETLDTMMVLLDWICGDWSAASANAIAGALRGLTQTQIAEVTGVSQPAVSKSLNGGGWVQVKRVVDWWEAFLSPEWRDHRRPNITA
ncbi:MAG: hypothetical protein ACOX9R_13445 [Armatimonadota bacterium]|jgi:predicted XRE-type DNA-binding protein